jgi:hypothetical protein
MKRSPSRHAAALTAILLAVTTAGFLAGCASPHDGATASVSSRAADPAVTQRNVIVINCLGRQQTRPSSFILTCADAGDVLTALHWVSWASQAFGTGTEMIKTCKPNCAEGGFASYPALIALWRPEPLPGHPASSTSPGSPGSTRLTARPSTTARARTPATRLPAQPVSGASR